MDLNLAERDDLSVGETLDIINSGEMVLVAAVIYSMTEQTGWTTVINGIVVALVPPTFLGMLTHGSDVRVLGIDYKLDLVNERTVASDYCALDFESEHEQAEDFATWVTGQDSAFEEALGMATMLRRVTGTDAESMAQAFHDVPEALEHALGTELADCVLPFALCANYG
jgi:hypothetical protein